MSNVRPEPAPATLEVVPLGGLGEFGMNMMAVSWQDTTIVLDAGVMFPDPDQLGVDLIIPDLSYLEARRNRSARSCSRTGTRTISAPCLM